MILFVCFSINQMLLLLSFIALTGLRNTAGASKAWTGRTFFFLLKDGFFAFRKGRKGLTIIIKVIIY